MAKAETIKTVYMTGPNTKAIREVSPEEAVILKRLGWTEAEKKKAVK